MYGFREKRMMGRDLSSAEDTGQGDVRSEALATSRPGAPGLMTAGTLAGATTGKR